MKWFESGSSDFVVRRQGRVDVRTRYPAWMDPRTVPCIAKSHGLISNPQAKQLLELYAHTLSSERKKKDNEYIACLQKFLVVK